MKLKYGKSKSPRIVLVAGIILTVLTLLVGVVVFTVMQRYSEKLLDTALQSSLQSRVQLTEAEIKAGFGKTTLAATRPRFIDLVQRLNTHADDSSARTMLNEVALSFLPSGLTALAVFDKNGLELGHAGTFAPNPASPVRLHLPGLVQLTWGRQLLLNAAVDMKLDGQVVGKLVTQTTLPATHAGFKDASRLGKTGEMVLCAPLGPDMQCFPSTLSLEVFTLPRFTADGTLLPMADALDGKTGFSSALDYRHQKVKAAYAPVGTLGLGMVLKADSADLYASVWQQLQFLIPLMLAMLALALLSLRWLLAPLVRQLVSSEARIAALNTELEQRVEQRTAQLEASNRELQEFAYSVAHDLRQPFIAIGGFSGLLARSAKDERDRHYIARINAGVRKAGELTDALLELANLSRVELRMQKVDLSAMARMVVNDLQSQDQTRRASFNIQSGLVVQADAVLIRLVMHELLANAWKYTSRQSHPQITFDTLTSGAGALAAQPVYRVTDNGTGFDMTHIDKLFRSFQRLHTEGDFPGSGADLVKVQRVVMRHGGKVWADSVLGKGASFFFTLGSPQH